MNMAKIEACDARMVLRYDPLSGDIFRTVSIGNSSKVGLLPQTVNDNGYSRTNILGKRYLTHRVVWLLHYGEWPKGQVDHIDGNRQNNKISNLRDVGYTENAQNTHKPKGSNKYMGVTYCKKRNKYASQISIGPRGNAKVKHLGRFDSAEEAHEVYLAAKRVLHPAFSG